MRTRSPGNVILNIVHSPIASSGTTLRLTVHLLFLVMDPNATQVDNQPTSVLYHCSCGARVVLDPAVGGVCPECHRTVSAKLLEHDLAMTISLDDQSFQLNQTLPRSGTVQRNAPVLDPTDPEILIGEMFGHFRIVAPLGSGGMGQVYRAFDTSLQRYVAVKLLRSGIHDSMSSNKPISSDKEVDKLLQEAISQARVSHPNIVTIYYVGKQNGNPFLAMELINGDPLSQRIKAGPLPFDEVARISLDIANALKFSYDLDIIHGDIKPSNVLIGKDGSAKLSDFGMARRATDDSSKNVGGTPNYLAPGIFKGERPSIQSDIYALGVTLYEMTFGKLPYTLNGGSVAQWIEIHENNELEFPVPWPPSLPEAWKTVLSKMLAKDADQRYDRYEDLISDIERLRPVAIVNARIFPRLIAAGVDWLSVLSMALALQIGLQFANVEQMLTAHPSITMLLQICNFIPMVIYLTLVYFWRQSVGRSLMHIRVVNMFGMKPAGNQMAMRSAIRMQFPWVVILLGLFNVVTTPWIVMVLFALFIASVLFLVMDIGFMVIYPKSRSIHDLVARTCVVLDTNN